MVKRAMLRTFLVVLLLISTFKLELMSQNGQPPKNSLGQSLKSCCTDPITGYYRNGRCDTGPEDFGTHVVCAVMTSEFLEFTKSQGNYLSTARPEYNFPGLKPGDKWCLCALRWKEAYQNDCAPQILLESTHEKALEFISLDVLRQFALDQE